MCSVSVSLKTWMAKDPKNRKLCPGCSVTLEKDGGCHHMTCAKCNIHMCWLCMETFKTGRETYAHMGSGTCRYNLGGDYEEGFNPRDYE